MKKLEERIQIYDPAKGEFRRGNANWKQEIQALPHKFLSVKVTSPFWNADRVFPGWMFSFGFPARWESNPQLFSAMWKKE